MAAYTAIDDPELYIQCKLYTGTGSEIAATLDGSENMQPDLVAIKARTDAESFKVYDSVRGVTKHIEWDSTDAEATEAQGLKSFDSDGFTIGTYSSINASDSHNYVAWCWKAGTAFSNDASATSIGSIDSTGSVNDTAGISICSFTGTGSNGTIKHGLSTAPRAMLFKNRDEGAEGWFVFHESVGNTKRLNLDDVAAESASSTFWQDTSPSSSIFTVGSNHGCNGPDAMIGYIFSEKQGFSKFGQYYGNANADGPFVYTGFKVGWLLIRRPGASENWMLLDNKRLGYNGANYYFESQANSAEATGGDRVDFLSNGFKIRNTWTSINNSGSKIIYMAFAEAPFVNSNGVPCNAR